MSIMGGIKSQKPYGESFASGDVITLTLNIDENYVQFARNNKEFEKISIKELTTKEFHLAVWMNYADDQVTIIEDKDI